MQKREKADRGTSSLLKTGLRAPLIDQVTLTDHEATGVIKAVIEKAYGVDDLTDHNRRKRPTEARMVAMWMARELTAFGLVDIGIEFDRDHTTVMNNVARTSGRRDSDARFEGVTDRLKATAVREMYRRS